MSTKLSTLKTLTELRVFSSSFELYTYYDGVFDVELPDIKYVEIATSKGTLEGVSYVEGELLVKMKNYPDDVRVGINGLGELVVWARLGVENYSINQQGELEYDIS